MTSNGLSGTASGSRRCGTPKRSARSSHARDDRVIPVAEGRLIAATIPGALYEELNSRNHILLSDEVAWAMFLGTVERFLDAELQPRSIASGSLGRSRRDLR